jgi:phenylalanyl-tRNA synthetase beta chain
MTLTQGVPVSEFTRLLGEPVDAADIVAKLTAYGVAAKSTSEQIVATIASYRQDYLHAVDVVEDYAISRGYDTLSATMEQEFTVGRLCSLTESEDLLRDLMIGFGFDEAICNILTSEEAVRTWMDLPFVSGAPPFHGGATVRIENVMNQNYAHLRDWIIPSLLEIEENLGSRTESRLAAIIADESASFDAAQSVIYALFGSLGIEFQVQAWQHPSFIDGRVALLTTKANTSGEQVKLGFLGELSPQVLTNWGARVPIAAFELSLNALPIANNDSKTA